MKENKANINHYGLKNKGARKLTLSIRKAQLCKDFEESLFPLALGRIQPAGVIKKQS